MLYIIKNEIAHLFGEDFDFACTGSEVEEGHIVLKSPTYYRLCKKCFKQEASTLLKRKEVEQLTRQSWQTIKYAMDNYSKHKTGSKALRYEVINKHRMVAIGEALRWVDQYKPGTLKQCTS